MAFFWLNRFNMIEYDGPFETADAARNDAVQTFIEIQGGVALDIAVIESGQTQNPEYFQSASERGCVTESLANGHIIYEGYIENGKWGDGQSPRYRAA